MHFYVQAKDVLHDFWVPAFRMKIDAVPGITTNYRVTPNRLGTYPVVCAELCGLGHSVMRSTAHVVTPAAFDAWIAKQTAPAARRRRRRRRDRRQARRSPRRSTARRSSTAPAAAAATRSPTPARTAHDRPRPRQGPQGQGRGVHQDVDRRTRAPRSPQGFPDGIMPKTYADSLSPEELDALVTVPRQGRREVSTTMRSC